jgi:hypothetical protein
MELLTPELRANITEICTWTLEEMKSEVRALNIATLQRLFATADGVNLRQSDPAIADVIDDTLLRIGEANSFLAFMAWNVEGARPMFLEHEMERIRLGAADDSRRTQRATS